MSDRPTVSRTNDLLLEEWKESRSIIDNLDNLLAGLRKYGFSFITALLGADSILGQASGQTSIVLSPSVKLGVMIVTLTLIIGLYATDRFYRIIQEGAVASALGIEKQWKSKNSEDGPTQAIVLYNHLEKGYLFIDLLYVLSGLANLLLGAFILYPNSVLITLLFLASLFVGGFGYYLRWIVVTGNPRKKLMYLIKTSEKDSGVSVSP